MPMAREVKDVVSKHEVMVEHLASAGEALRRIWARIEFMRADQAAAVLDEVLPWVRGLDLDLWDFADELEEQEVD